MGFFVLPEESTHSTVLMNSARNSRPIEIYIDYVYLHSHDEVKELHVKLQMSMHRCSHYHVRHMVTLDHTVANCVKLIKN